MSKTISKTLVIGLGGTGQTVIREIKKRLFRRYGEIPSLVRFYSLDTDDNAFDETWFKYYYNGKTYEELGYNIQENEFRKLHRPAMDVIKADSKCKNLRMDVLEKLSNRMGGGGANGYRIMGRAHFLHESHNILADLRAILSSLRSASLTAEEKGEKNYDVEDNCPVRVYIIASLSGGTGSSAFLDLPQILQLAGLTYGRDRIFGIFFMPRFFMNYPNTDNRNINAYVALSELDYYIETIGSNLDRLTNNYGGNNIADATNSPGLYDNVFLVDHISKGDVTREIKDAAGYVASFVTAAVSADSNTLLSSFVNSNHKDHSVRGKYQRYSGLGYCEMRFNRQDLVKYLLNCQLLNTLIEYKEDSDRNVNDEVEKFINFNNLNEGWEGLTDEEEDTRSIKNDLIDSIYKLSDDRFRNLIMGTPATGKDAAVKIVQNRDNYLVAVKAEADKCVKEFAKTESTITRKLKEKLDECQCGMGFASFPDMAKRFITLFKRMQDGLNKEIGAHKNRIKVIEGELKPLELFIKQNTSGGWFGSKTEAQKSRITAYKGKVQGVASSTLASENLEIIRKEAAVKIYEKLIAIIESYYKEDIEKSGKDQWIKISGSSAKIQGMYDSIKGLLECENDAYNPSLAAKNEVIFLDAYFKDYFKTHPAFEFTPELKKMLNERYEKILNNPNTEIDNNLMAELRESLLEKLADDSIIKKLRDGIMSLDELFLLCFGDGKNINNPRDLVKFPQLKIFAQLRTLFDPLWQWTDFADDGSLPPAIHCVVGVNDMENNILHKRYGYKNYIPDSEHLGFTGMGDPDRIVFFLQETAIPACKLSNENEMKESYEANKDKIYAFTDTRLEDIDLISPEPDNVKADIAWAYGWMHGLITSFKEKIQIKVSGAYEISHNVTKSNGYLDYFNKVKNSDISVCYKAFKKDNDVIDDIYQQIIKLINTDIIAEMLMLEKWVNQKGMWTREVRGKKEISMTDAERLVIKKEVPSLAKLFPDLNKTGVTIHLDPTSMIVSFNDPHGVLDDRRQMIAEAEK